MTISELIKEAVDLMSSQQAMPDDKALNHLEDLMYQAYQLGMAQGEIHQG